MTTYNKAIEIANSANAEVANLKDWQVPSKAARAIREIARTAKAEEFIGTIAEMVAKFPTLFAKTTNTESVADHNPEDIFVWHIAIPAGRNVLRASDMVLVAVDEITK